MKELIVKTALPWMVKMLEKQGIPFLLLALAVGFFYQKTELMEAERMADKKIFQSKLDVCQATIITMYKEDRAKLIKVLEANTKALEKNCN